MKILYKNYHIEYNPKPIPDSRFDYDFWADGYDGSEDSKDIRSGTGSSIEDCKNKIDEMIQESI